MPSPTDAFALLPEVAAVARCVGAQESTLVLDAEAFESAARSVLALPEARRAIAAEHLLAVTLRIGTQAGTKVACDAVLEPLTMLVARLLGSEAAATASFEDG